MYFDEIFLFLCYWLGLFSWLDIVSGRVHFGIRRTFIDTAVPLIDILTQRYRANIPCFYSPLIKLRDSILENRRPLLFSGLLAFRLVTWDQKWPAVKLSFLEAFFVGIKTNRSRNNIVPILTLLVIVYIFIVFEITRYVNSQVSNRANRFIIITLAYDDVMILSILITVLVELVSRRIGFLSLLFIYRTYIIHCIMLFKNL